MLPAYHHANPKAVPRHQWGTVRCREQKSWRALSNAGETFSQGAGLRSGPHVACPALPTVAVPQCPVRCHAPVQCIQLRLTGQRHEVEPEQPFRA